MRERVEFFANSRNEGLAEIQRQAIEFFLSKNGNKNPMGKN